MLDTILNYIKNIFKSRLVPIVIVYIGLFAIVVIRMFNLQIVKGDEFVDKNIVTTEKERDIKSTRGKIYDCNGKLLASNELSYSVIIEDTGEVTDNEKKNAMISEMVNIIKKNGDEIDLDFPIRLNKDNQLEFAVDENEVLRFKRDAYFQKSIEDLSDEQYNATAEEMYEYFRKDVSSSGPKFDISDGYTVEEALEIMKIRYYMLINSYTKYIPIIVSAGVKNSTVVSIKENCADMPGVSIREDTKRLYYDSKYFSNIIGYTGPVTSEDIESIQESFPDYDYNLTDQIGKTGIELSLEETLRGEKGSETLVIDNNSRIIDLKKKNDPVAGNDIYLTIDADLQKACYDILEKKLAGILISKINNSADAGTKGKSASDIRIPIYDVYNSCITNNIIDTAHFQKKKASVTEKKVYKRYLNTKNKIFDKLGTYIDIGFKKSSSELSDEYAEYLKYAYTVISDNGILLTDKLDKNSDEYTNYVNGNLSFSKFLEYAIISNAIEFDKLDVGNEFYTTEELFDIVKNYIIDKMGNSTSFDKLIYKYMIYQYKISGTEICLILMDQGIVGEQGNLREKLITGVISPYSFMISKITKLELTPAMLALDPCSGSIVLTDVNTGAVKAYVTYPTYDNNKFANSIDSDYYYNMITNGSLPLLNRPSMQKTAPGSTFKMVTSTAALEEYGILNGPGEKILDKHEFKEVDPSPKCWSRTSHGKIDVTDALRHSCNYYYYEVGYRLGLSANKVLNNNKGLDTLKKYASMFGLDSESGIELPELSPQISDSDCVRSAIGQGTNSFTPAQLARYVTTIANSGTCYDLTLIDRIHKTKNDKSVKHKSQIHGTVDISQTSWNLIHSGMRKVVTGGSVSSLFKKMNVDVAGKTGTAQENDSKPNHALFVSYAPYDNPEIAVTTVIPNGYTSGNAAELARDIYIYYYDKEKRKSIINSKVQKPENTSHAFSD